MTYGTHHEDEALADYSRLVPPHAIAEHGFSVWRGDPAHGWLGASPDGLLSTREGHQHHDHNPHDHPPPAAVADDDAWWLAAPGEGVLEIKCPYKCSPLGRNLKPKPNEYYMHQVQALMEIHGREWCNLFYWSEENGSVVAHVRRDRDYFAVLHEVMADFWWRHVVPARLELAAGASEQEVRERYEPRYLHPYAEAVRAMSLDMLRAAPRRWFSAAETRGAEGYARVVEARRRRLEEAEARRALAEAVAGASAASLAVPSAVPSAAASSWESAAAMDSFGEGDGLTAGALAIAAELAGGGGGGGNGSAFSSGSDADDGGGAAGLPPAFS